MSIEVDLLRALAERKVRFVAIGVWGVLVELRQREESLRRRSQRRPDVPDLPSK